MHTPTTPGILSGLRVIELSAFVAVPFAGMTLAQLGAEVIRVDPVGGAIDEGRWPLAPSGRSLYWAGLNKGKRSIAIDLRSDAGREIVTRLITEPGDANGILITNLNYPWLDYRRLTERRPDVIAVSLSGNPDGSTAVDYTVNAAAGFPMVTGTPPTNHVLPAWDVIAGAMTANAVLAAERNRARTGDGDHVRLALSDIAFSTVGHLGNVAEVALSGADRAPHGNFLYGSFGKDFATSDGKRVMVVALTRRQWQSLVQATGTTDAFTELERSGGVDLSDEGTRFEVRDTIAEILEPWFNRSAFSDVVRALDEHGVLWGPYQTFRELVESDPRLSPASNPMWTTLDQPGAGVYQAAGSPIRFTSATNLAARPAPVPGEDTGSVLSDVLGLDVTSIAALKREGTI